jgi:hypothetical protein
VDQHGALTCGICPLRAGDDSIKISDVPLLLRWARDFVHLTQAHDLGSLGALLALARVAGFLFHWVRS